MLALLSWAAVAAVAPSCMPTEQKGAACTVDRDCDDNDPCTITFCNKGTKRCEHTTKDGCTSTSGSTSSGSTTSGSTSSGSTTTTDPSCDGDGTCDFTFESCDCGDCALDPACGADCTPVELAGDLLLNGTFAEDDLATNFDGPEPDSIQLLLYAALDQGTTTLGPPDSKNGCGNTKVCCDTVGDNFLGQRRTVVSGKVNVTSAAPKLAGTLEYFVFRPYSVDMNNNITVDASGGCQVLKAGTFKQK